MSAVDSPTPSLLRRQPVRVGGEQSGPVGDEGHLEPLRAHRGVGGEQGRLGSVLGRLEHGSGHNRRGTLLSYAMGFSTL